MTLTISPSRSIHLELQGGAGEGIELSVQELDAGRRAAWEAFVANAPEATFFHSLAWMDAVGEAFGHEPIYLMAFRGREVEGILPLFLVKSFLAGRLLVSVPYGVYGGPVGASFEAISALVKRAKRIADERQVSLLDLRCEKTVATDLAVVDRYVTFRRALPEAAEDVLGTLPRKARAAARKARDKCGLTVDFDAADLKTVWKLYSVSMRRLGSLNYPFAFFERLVERTPGKHLVTVVRHQGRPISALLTFFFGETALPYFSGCDSRYNALCPNNLLYLATMERSVKLGYKVFDFGRSRKDNAGSYSFKKNHGFEPVELGYQYYVPEGREAPDLTPSNRKFDMARRIWRHLPLWASRPIGAWVSRAIPG